MFIYPGADRFIFGNLFDTLAYTTAQKESEEPIINGTGWLLEQIGKDEGKKFDAAEIPVAVIVNTGVVCLFVQDPEIVQDLFVK